MHWIICAVILTIASPVYVADKASDPPGLKERKAQLERLCRESGGVPIYENIGSTEVKPLCRYPRPTPKKFPDPSNTIE